MKKSLLQKKIDKIQTEYKDLLNAIIPMLEEESYMLVALDAVSVFWRRKKEIITLYLKYVAKKRNVLFYTAASYFDFDRKDQYPFLLMGDVHIFDDPMGEYCEACRRGNPPAALISKVLICAKNNLEIMEKYSGLMLIIPLRFMGSDDERREFFEIGDRAFLSFFNNISTIEEYFETCNTIDAIEKTFKIKYQQTVWFYEKDNIREAFAERVSKAVERMRRIMGDDYSVAELFYFSIVGFLKQSIDVLSVTVQFGAIPMFVTSIAFYYCSIMFPNFIFDNPDDIKRRIEVYNVIYSMVDWKRFENLSISEYRKKAVKFKFEEKALRCYLEYQHEKTLIGLKKIIGQFQLFCEEECALD